MRNIQRSSSPTRLFPKFIEVRNVIYRERIVGGLFYDRPPA